MALEVAMPSVPPLELRYLSLAQAGAIVNLSPRTLRRAIAAGRLCAHRLGRLTRIDAAHLLRLHPEELRQRAKAGRIPGAKVGRRWVFVKDDLVQYVRSLYAAPRQALQVTLRKEMECHFANAAVSGGSTSSHPMESEYAE